MRYDEKGRIVPGRAKTVNGPLQILECVPDESIPFKPETILQRSPMIAIKNLVVTVNGDEAVVTGRVPHPYLKQLAEEMIEPTLGHLRLVSQIEVAPNSRPISPMRYDEKGRIVPGRSKTVNGPLQMLESYIDTSIPFKPETILQRSPMIAIKNLVVTVNDDEAVVTGRVPHPYLKQLAEEMIEPTLGHLRLVSRIEVLPTPSKR